MTTKKWIKKAKDRHGNKYDYSKSEYTYARNKIKIICKIHGEFLQIAHIHTTKGYGCPTCSGNKKMTIFDFIKRAQSIHGNKYDYTLVEYKNIDTKIKIYCINHAIIFNQSPYHHFKSSTGGCPICISENISIKQQKSQNQFIIEAKKLHNDKYDYSNSIYEGAHVKISIICIKHGIFKQTPANHLSGQECPACGFGKNISNGEIEWLNQFNIKQNNRNIIVYINNKKYKIDGFDPKTNTIYEYNGDFWHGNPKKFKSTDINPKTKTTYGELFEATMKKERNIKNAGYNFISIWESDFIIQKSINKLQHDIAKKATEIIDNILI